MSGTIESEELDIMLKGLFAMAGMEFDQQVPNRIYTDFWNT